MDAGSDFIVVGGGVIGCSIAYHLAGAGASVTLVEQGQPGQGASRAAAGMLVPLSESHGPGPFADLALASFRLYPAWAEELRQETGIDLELTMPGLLRVALTAEQEGELRERLRWQRTLEPGLEWLEGWTVRELEPGLTPAVRAALYSPHEGQVNPVRLVDALAVAAQRRGVRILTGTPVLGFLRRGRRITGVRTPRGGLPGGHVVLALGAWTGRLLGRLGVHIATPPRRGQMLAYPGTPLRRIVWGAQGYLVPKPNGTTWAGATVEDVGFRPGTTRRGLAFLRRMAGELAPAFRHIQEGAAWAGLRPGSPDGLPIMGTLPGWEGLSVATGHFRNGILLAPITGRLMSQLLLGERPELPLAPFSPGRFL